MAESSQSSFNSSSSTPSFIETPENSIIDQLSSYASSLAGQMQSWANGVFAQTSQITNQAVGNFFNVSQRMLGLSGNMTDQYNNLFAPENAQLVADANSYASPARMAVDMGQAGATQAQAGDQALKNSEEALRSYGINPSDGRYAALDKAAAVQNAANIAGAQNTQRNADIATGQRLRSEAVQVGAQLPAAISNANNTAIQANSGASNATLANANTGRNLMSLPNDFLKTAMDVKLPPSGQNSRSSGTSSGSSSSPDRQGGSPGSGGSGSGGGGAGNGAGGPAWMPQHTGYQSDHTSGAAHGGMQPGSKIMSLPGQDGPPPEEPPPQPPEWNPETGTMTSQGGLNDPFQDYGGGGNAFGNSFGQDFGNGNTFDFGQTDQGWGGSQFSGGQDFGGGGNDQTGMGAYNYNPQANATDPGWDNTYNQPAPDTNWGTGADPYQQADTASSGYDTSNSNSDFYAGDYSAPSDSYDMGGAFAAGGPIPASASPSGGAQTDDISAQGPGGRQLRMNANEFVIPQDVALWKGQEFFQNLIDQSRKKRMGASAQPKPMPVR